ncbi:rhodanese-like domain-containing protein [Bernardetia sp. OM2101]|uniref:rhodanese-like domain-containing protein n=1 Tax=Bernardetia sp. OM2101 TaxID=3344876 RepID=UPI0035CFC922
MKKLLLLFSLFSLITCFSACKENNKEVENTENSTQENQKEEELEAESDSRNLNAEKQKVEKLEAPEFRVKMVELRLYNLIDVRTPQEFAQSSIPKAKNIDFNNDSFEEELDKLEKYRPLFIYCKSGGRSAKAVEKAKEMGFERIIELDGGMDAWKEVKAETQHGI